MSTERDYEEYFRDNGWKMRPVEDRGWAFQHDKVPGYVQANANGQWWHVVKEKERAEGRDLGELKKYFHGLTLDHQPVRRVDWSGKQHEKQYYGAGSAQQLVKDYEDHGRRDPWGNEVEVNPKQHEKQHAMTHER